jgi:hypothetical protein
VTIVDALQRTGIMLDIIHYPTYRTQRSRSWLQCRWRVLILLANNIYFLKINWLNCWDKTRSPFSTRPVRWPLDNRASLIWSRMPPTTPQHSVRKSGRKSNHSCLSYLFSRTAISLQTLVSKPDHTESLEAPNEAPPWCLRQPCVRGRTEQSKADGSPRYTHW